MPSTNPTSYPDLPLRYDGHEHYGRHAGFDYTHTPHVGWIAVRCQPYRGQRVELVLEDSEDDIIAAINGWNAEHDDDLAMEQAA